jgi:hypothetical protein
MKDPRISRLAQVLVHYSIDVKPGSLVRIAGLRRRFRSPPRIVSPALRARVYARHDRRNRRSLQARERRAVALVSLLLPHEYDA